MMQILVLLGMYFDLSPARHFYSDWFWPYCVSGRKYLATAIKKEPLSNHRRIIMLSIKV